MSCLLFSRNYAVIGHFSLASIILGVLYIAYRKEHFVKGIRLQGKLVQVSFYRFIYFR